MFTQPQMPNDPYAYQQHPQYQQTYPQYQQPYQQQYSRYPQPYVPQEPTAQQIQQTVGTQYLQLKGPVLQVVRPWVQYGLKEVQHTSVQHAMTELAAIMYLIGKGYDPKLAHYIVESWEKQEHF